MLQSFRGNTIATFWKQNNLAGCCGQQEYKKLIHMLKSFLYLMEPIGFGGCWKSIFRKPSRLWIGIMPVNISLRLQKLRLAQIQVKPGNGLPANVILVTDGLL